MQEIVKKGKNLIIYYINKVDSKLLGAEANEDKEEIMERQEEILKQRRAIENKYESPDILEYKTDNFGLKPYMLHLKALRQGE